MSNKKIAQLISSALIGRRVFVPIISAMVIWPSGLRRQRLIGCLPDGAARAEDTEHRGETQIFLIRRENGPNRIQTRTDAPLRVVVVFYVVFFCIRRLQLWLSRRRARQSARPSRFLCREKVVTGTIFAERKKSCWEFLEKWWNNKQKKNRGNLLLTDK